jgi:superfamily II DNA or RNA helicase
MSDLDPRVVERSAPSAMPTAAPDERQPEAFAVLTAEARRHATGVPPEFLARHALAITAGTDFTVAEAALEALVRRATAVERDRLVVLRRPTRGRRGPARGAYRVGRKGQRERAYDVWLESLAPLSGSCACADYGKAGLGLCKHLFAVIAPLVASPAGRAGAKARPPADVAGTTTTAPPEREHGPWLRWDPVRPFTGPGDWLDRVGWQPRASSPGGSATARVVALFTAAPEAGGSGLRRLALPAGDRAARRTAVETLLAWIERRDPGAAEPALAPLLRAERDQLARTDAAVAPREVTRHLAGLKHKLFAYQREGVARFLASSRLLLADDMGLGKTAQAIAACHVLFAAKRVARGLIVVPAALKAQWAREWQQFTDLALTVVEGSAAERAAIYRRPPRGVLLVNYEQVLRDLPLMLAYAPEVVVLDEAQRIKNWAAKTSAHVKQLAAPWRLVLTGTPMENRLGELSSILDWVDETALEPRWRLGSWHAVRADGRHELVSARNLDTLRVRLAPCLLRRVRTEVLSQLPSRRDTLVAVPLTADQRAAHDDLDAPIARLAATARRRPLTQVEFLRLMSLFTQQRILCNGLAQRDYDEVWPALARGRVATETVLARLASPKLIELRERIAAIAIDQGRKVVVFSQWRRMLKLAHWAIGDLLATTGLRAAFFTGQEAQRRRTQNLVDFHDDPATRVLFATDAGGVGLNLQKAASCIINLDLPWNPAVLEQRIARVHRFGQTQPVDVYALVADGGIEARIAALVADKKALFRGLFDGDSDTVDFAHSGSFLSRIEALIERPTVATAAVDPALGDSGDAGDLDLGEPQDPGDPADERDPDGISTDGAPAAVVQPIVPTAAAPTAAALAAAPTAAPDPSAEAARDAAGLTRLLSQISVRTLPDGRLAVEAAPAAAAALSTVLRSLAALLDAQAG